MANKRNYAKELNTLIETFTHEEKRPTLLLHACCAPCSSAVLEKLTAHFKITVLFYNPNIYPEAEYQKREAELKRLISEMPCTKEVALVDLPYVPEEFFTAVRGLEHIPASAVLRATSCVWKQRQSMPQSIILIFSRQRCPSAR